MALRNGKQTVTLKDVAEAVGYSVNTVSRALRGKDDIAKATRDRIKQTAIELGYINNAAASSLRLGYTNTIAVILGDISNPHFSIITKEVEERARKLGYATFLLSTNEDEDLEFNAIQLALNKNVDGIILCPAQKSRKNVDFLISTRVPFVLIGRHFDNVETDYVVCDDEMGGYQATKYLIEQGHRDILMLNGPSYISSSNERYAGYCRALSEYGIPIRTELVCESDVTCGRNGETLRKLDEAGIHYSAIFAFSDLLAWEAWTYQISSGRKVPENCSIVGFDHIQSRLTLPFNLASICSHKFRMSVAAVDLLVDQMKAEETPYQKRGIVIETELVEGDSASEYSCESGIEIKNGQPSDF